MEDIETKFIEFLKRNNALEQFEANCERFGSVGWWKNSHPVMYIASSFFLVRNARGA